MLKKLFGKYRVLVVSIALFLVFDLGVLVLNFYTSGKIAEQTEKINIAGQQRTLTQQMSKATLYIKAQKLQQWVYQTGLDELGEHYTLFDNTMDALNNGGQTVSAETGELVTLLAVSDVQGKAIMREATVIWSGFQNALEPMMVDTLITDEEIKPASTFIAKNNLKLYEVMNRLTEHFTHESEKQTSFLRLVQVAGITLATINFFIILFHFLKQLRTRDEQIEIKQHESDQILKTIGEGVFLIDKDLVIGGQHSQFLQTIFQTKRISNRRLVKFLKPHFPKKTIKTTIDFVNLYFTDHINPDLIEDVNPLKQVRAKIVLPSGEMQEKVLNFSFARLRQANDETVVLATVKDITDTILLAEQSDKLDTEVEQQLALFSQILPIPVADLDVFIREGMASLDHINEQLKSTKQGRDNYRRPLNRLFQEAHKFKGNALALNFEWIANQVHEFESSIDALSKQAEQGQISGRGFVPLTLSLKELYRSLEKLSEFRSRLMSYGRNENRRVGGTPTIVLNNALTVENKRWFDLSQFCTKLSNDAGCNVDLHLRGFNTPLAKKLDDVLYPLTVQLIRNSIVHGIESEQQREVLKKPIDGRLSLSISHDRQGGFRYVFEDDGGGFNYDLIRQKLKEKGLYSNEQLAEFDKHDLVKQIFSNQFSTHDGVDNNAGRGVGLGLVLEQVKQLNGHLKIRSIRHQFTQFIVDFKYVEKFSDLQKAS
ncbi:MAG: type IV pili methyl-accepting chemotaxis transducer N-terminal domain-containing protein [Arenicella sp.]|nr:type IV pili methyl-accepting chemotaxis transducer N-terminal domain-containing protein [Arenicella sp.]